jgi:hypothetical protein
MARDGESVIGSRLRAAAPLFGEGHALNASVLEDSVPKLQVGE